MAFATPQKLQFSRAVNEKLTAVAAKLRENGVAPETAIPSSLQPHYKLMREMHARLFSGKNLEYSHAEMMAEQRMARWILEEWHRLHGTPVPDTQWTG